MKKIGDEKSCDTVPLMQKNYLVFLQIGMLLANALLSTEYTVTILFISIGKSDIYQHKGLGMSATDFYLNIRKPERVTNKY
jgi:hypothetical protein